MKNEDVNEEDEEDEEEEDEEEEYIPRVVPKGRNTLPRGRRKHRRLNCLDDESDDDDGSDEDFRGSR